MRILKDEKIMRLLEKNPSAGMDLLIETYGSLAGYIVRHKLSSTCSEEDVEECVADVFVDFYKQLDRVDLKKGSIKTYISTIARRRAVDYFQAAVKNQFHVTELDEAVSNSIPDQAPTPESTMVINEENSFLLKEVQKLGEPDGEILFRRYYLDQSLSEIADAIGMKRPAVSKRISRALEKLKFRMEGFV
ncbi:MAG: sigma-70 family RNA polymerase sigma factor [Lachnospiraceae bacterium]|nr:sigma-70 family RNA polymerase sigma factor [Lachnospiraceae bacterium]